MIRSILYVALSMVLIASILTPSVMMLTDFKIEFFNPMELSQEETKSIETDVFEKEVISHADHKYKLVAFKPNSVLNGFYGDDDVTHVSEIVLPPPENI